MSYSFQKKLVIFSFLFIPVSLLLLFLFYPTLRLLQFSLTDWNGMSKSFHYVGIDNYRAAFNNSDVWKALSNNFLYFGIHALFIPLEVMVAVLLNNKMRASNFFRSIVFMPYILNGVAVAYLFSFLYNPINGPLNAFLEAFGLSSWIQNWLSDKGIVNYSLVVVSLWRFSGLHVILFLAGLQSIPQDLYEAATIDGAGPLKKFRYITLPGISRVMEIVLFLNVRGALQVFDVPFLITQGGPGIASTTFTVYTIQTAFKYNNYGLASSLGVILMLMIIAFSYFQSKLFKGKGD
ncbi:carbohydrate ABC transporter permease [Cohnella suwonensis]|uniref:Carbohydrate ABC transporter permease n=1 Tax=Cohnella suwonensis TaxID=696072 RepID=A0ABW0LVF2_9BACL